MPFLAGNKIKRRQTTLYRSLWGSIYATGLQERRGKKARGFSTFRWKRIRFCWMQRTDSHAWIQGQLWSFRAREQNAKRKLKRCFSYVSGTNVEYQRIIHKEAHLWISRRCYSLTNIMRLDHCLMGGQSTHICRRNFHLEQWRLLSTKLEYQKCLQYGSAVGAFTNRCTNDYGTQDPEEN